MEKQCVYRKGIVMLFRNQEKELAELDYQLRKENVDQDIIVVMSSLKEKTPEGFWLEQIVIQDICFERIYINESGIVVFCNYDKELTDPSLWKELKEAYDVFTVLLKGIEGPNLTFYAVLNGPITQKPYYALFNPKIEFLAPVTNIEETFLAGLAQSEKIFSEEDITELLSRFEEALVNPTLDENIRVDENGEYLWVRGNWRARSPIDAEKYYKCTLFGGIFGVHKFYAKCYGSFIVYFLTLGFFGVGWILDLTEICLGIAKDRRKAYIGPFKDIKKKIVSTLITFVFYILVLVVCFGVIN